MEFCLFQPDIAGNVGTIIRIASCFAVTKVHIIMPTGFIFDDKAFKRAQMDYGSNVDIIKHNNFNAFIQAIDAKRIILLTTKVQQSYKDFQFQASDILMVGSESRGVPTEIMQQIQNQLTIPMHNTARSLNVAVAIGIVASAAFGIEL